MDKLIAFIFTGGALAGGIVYVVKILIAKAIDAGVLNYKSRLDKELDAHRHSLELLKIQYQIQFSSLNEKRGEFIAKLFSEMYELENAIQNYTSVIQNDWTEFGETYNAVDGQFKRVKSYFERNRIYLDEQLCNEIEQSLILVDNMVFQMSKAKSMGKTPGKTMTSVEFPEGKTPTEIWSEQDQKARKELVNNRKQLAQQFRLLIGVLPDQTPNQD